MSGEIEELQLALEDFDSRHTDAGLLLRYARGRIQNILARQALVILGSLALAVMSSPTIGFIALATTLFGELVDCLVLSRVEDQLQRGVPAKKLLFRTMISAAIQAISVSLFVSILWITVPHQSAMLLCLAYIAGGTVNSVMVLPYHRSASMVRIVILVLTLAGLFCAEWLWAGLARELFYYNVAGTVLFAYMLLPFVSFVTDGRQSDLRRQRQQIEQSLALAKTNARLSDREREGRRLASIAENAVDSIFMMDRNSRVLWVNPAFTRKSGYTLEEVVGRQPADFLYGPRSDRAVDKQVKKAIEIGLPARVENINYTKSGEPFWVETHVAPVLDENDHMETAISIERDITVAKKRELELAEAKRAAELGEKAKSLFLANMSHEIRTPMNGIMGMADLLHEADLSHDHGLYVQTIRQSAEALLTIINDILDFSKLQDGHLEMNPVVFETRLCVTSIMNLMRPQAEAKDLTLLLDIAEDVPDEVFGDDGRLRQILVNVMGNAIKFTDAGSVSVSLATYEAHEGRGLEVLVRDTGVGIAPDRHEHVFEQFAQADADTTRRFGGTGLGLAISRKLARKMGGDITVSSTSGEGSCFAVRVEFPAAHSVQSKDQASDELPANELFEGVTVLLAEDNKTNRLLVSKYLKDLPLELLEAEDGVQAVAMVAKHQPDIVLMDMSMPQMDGLDATRAIRADAAVQPAILALTANAYRSDREACLQAGMDGFLSKPVRRTKLIQLLAKMVVDQQTQSKAS